jgi:hypothetical protein
MVGWGKVPKSLPMGKVQAVPTRVMGRSWNLRLTEIVGVAPWACTTGHA